MNEISCLSVKNEYCADCGCGLWRRNRIARKSDGSLLCTRCAENGHCAMEIETEYTVNQLGVASPISDEKKIALPQAIEDLLGDIDRVILCSNFKMNSGHIRFPAFDERAAVVIQLPGGSSENSPQKMLFDECAELGIQANFAKRIHEPVVVRKSRMSDRRYIFVKTGRDGSIDGELLDSFRMTIDSLVRENPHFSRIYMERLKGEIYMERLKGDEKELAKVLLAKSGHECIYYDGTENTDSFSRDSQLFDIGFTKEDLFSYCRSRIIGQDEELRTAVYLIMDHVEKTASGAKDGAVSWVLTAPSGSGKTEFFKAVETFFREHSVPIPVIRCDLSQITETGWKGKEISSLIGQIKKATNEDINHSAICFLDEADKRLVPSVGSNGTNYNAAMQSNLLSMVEGSELDDGDDGRFDTSNTMFVFMGAFQSLRDDKRLYGEMLDEIGEYGGSPSGSAEEHFYEDITIEEMIDFGMIEELAGRLRMTVNFRKLPENSMRELIRSKCEQVSRGLRCKAMITERAVGEFMEIAYTNLGIRALINKLSELMIRQLASRRNVTVKPSPTT